MKILTGEIEEELNRPERGRSGGLRGGKSRAKKLTPEQRAEIARLAAQARWRRRGK